VTFTGGTLRCLRLRSRPRTGLIEELDDLQDRIDDVLGEYEPEEEEESEQDTGNED